MLQRFVFLRYVKRRAQEEFHKHAAEVDANRIQQFWAKAQSDLELVRRQAMVYTLFARKHKSIMVGPARELAVWLCVIHLVHWFPAQRSDGRSIALRRLAAFLQDMPLQRVKDTV
jgi:hypothetical protein